MKYSDYQRSRNLAWEILLNEGVNSLPVKVGTLCKQMGIHIKYYSSFDGNDGKSTIIDGVPIVFVNNNCSVERQRFTAAHELGHILLGHLGAYELVNREPSSKDNPIEQAANVFASRLLAPACVLWGCNVKTSDDIARLCNISAQSADYRMQRMQVLLERNKFLTSPLERRVYEQFKEYIMKNQL